VNPWAATAETVAALGAAGLAYSAGYEVRAFTMRHVTAPVLPTNASDLRILHISDMHLTPSQTKKQRWLSSLAELNPDFVIVTGDFLAHPQAVPAVLECLDPLLSVPGAFVFGSNDYYGPKLKNPARYLMRDTDRRIHGEPLPWPELDRGLSDRGWSNLTHRRVSITINGTAVELRGVDDPHLMLDDYSTVSGPVAEGHFGIGVTHAPYLRVLDAMAADSVPMIFAGHTHGGQLCIPFYGALVTNCDLDTKRAKGLHRHRDSLLHVSAGCGTNPYTPVRFACRPEATLVTLTSAPADK